MKMTYITFKKLIRKALFGYVGEMVHLFGWNNEGVGKEKDSCPTEN